MVLKALQRIKKPGRQPPWTGTDNARAVRRRD